MQKARVRLRSTDKSKIQELAQEIVEIGEEYNAKVSGPVPLPTDKLEIPTRKAPDGEGSETIERYEMHVHNRLIDIMESERALRQVMRVHVPEGVDIEVELTE
ncbi:30S ribosomal protein S10 [Candidatus Nanohalococcus occultus]|uniref:Small ribosomal subunit protein uS10 n=1 Tax=Candidatus Nanohalococcus occultus TaxID=2978047 RepID=A0ABY8CDB4_9ARCH|nr:Ribosomal protein S10 [Candidatus Nanohaloarchaeota archaeon SVXNc]